MDRECAEDLAAEYGYRETGARELRVRDWWSLQEPGSVAKSPREFAATVTRLRKRNWQRAHKPWRDPRQARAGAARLKAWRRRQHIQAAAVYACAAHDCAVQWCRVPFGRRRGNVRPKFCSKACFRRERARRMRIRRQA